MSGVYIKGMEMPSCCAECRFLDERGDYPCCIITDEQRGYNFRTRELRMPHCPLIHAPNHGRLIDADFFVERMEGLEKQAMTDGFDLGAFWYEAFAQHIKLSPTIIPASKEYGE